MKRQGKRSSLGLDKLGHNFARLNQEIKTLTQTNVTQKLFKSNGKITPDKKANQNLIAQCFLRQPIKPKIQRYPQEALLLSNRQNPKKESKEDEKK